MFPESTGVPENPATGSSNGCLTAYLVRHRWLGKTSIDIVSEQGFQMKRPSILSLRGSEESDGSITVQVGGYVVPVIEGHIGIS